MERGCYIFLMYFLLLFKVVYVCSVSMVECLSHHVVSNSGQLTI